MRRSTLLGLLPLGVFGALAGACSSAAPPSERGPRSAADLAQASVYDARGRSATCDAPRDDCAAAPADRDFLEACSLAGFQIRRCGCASLCTGDVTAFRRHFDAEGHGKECAPTDAACEAPPAKAAFQDACTERGGRLAQCGCEWLCSTNPAK